MGLLILKKNEMASKNLNGYKKVDCNNIKECMYLTYAPYVNLLRNQNWEALQMVGGIDSTW